MLMSIGLADSRTDAERKIKSGALEINGALWTELSYPFVGVLTLRLGKKWKKVTLS
jgi:tyrosyl-tRNA synthetase